MKYTYRAILWCNCYNCQSVLPLPDGCCVSAAQGASWQMTWCEQLLPTNLHHSLQPPNANACAFRQIQA